MSDLQDLIHKTSMDCLAKGRQQEQERIIKLLTDAQRCVLDEDCHCRDCCNCSIIALINGEK